MSFLKKAVNKSLNLATFGGYEAAKSAVGGDYKGALKSFGSGGYLGGNGTGLGGGEGFQDYGYGSPRGRELAEQLYGQSQEQTGKDVASIKSEYERRAMDPKFAQSQAAKGAQSLHRNLSQSLGRDSGVMQGANAKNQLMRQQLEVENQNRVKALGDYRSLIGNMVSGQGQLEMGYRGMDIASQPVTPPKSGLDSLLGEFLG